MRILRPLALAAALLAAACSRPVPPAKAAYVGAWKADRMQLVITADGYVRYERRSGNARTSINAPIQRFDGDNLVVGVGFLHTTFVVSRPPHHEGSRWKMTVDGIELERVAGPADDYASLARYGSGNPSRARMARSRSSILRASLARSWSMP